MGWTVGGRVEGVRESRVHPRGVVGQCRGGSCGLRPALTHLWPAEKRDNLVVTTTRNTGPLQ